MLSCLKLNPVLHVYIGKGLYSVRAKHKYYSSGPTFPLILVTHPLGKFLNKANRTQAYLNISRHLHSSNLAFSCSVL